jgi:hypothetical protein
MLSTRAYQLIVELVGSLCSAGIIESRARGRGEVEEGSTCVAVPALCLTIFQKLTGMAPKLHPIFTSRPTTLTVSNSLSNPNLSCETAPRGRGR